MANRRIIFTDVERARLVKVIDAAIKETSMPLFFDGRCGDPPSPTAEQKNQIEEEISALDRLKKKLGNL